MLSSSFCKGLRAWLAAPLAAVSLSLAACGGGGGAAPPAAAPPAPVQQACGPSTCGTLLVGLTDADGDFLSYTVDVVSLTLHKADGAVVQALPTRQRADFVQLVNMTELVTAAMVPNGTYVRASIKLDFGNAEVTVERDGAPVAAKVVNKDGQPLGLVDLAIRLDNRNHIFIAPGRPAFMQLDFDLAASHRVDLSTTPITAVSAPFVVATVEPVEEKDIRTRGPLVSVDTAASSYAIQIRPFHHADARHGQLTVHTTVETAFEIDGVEAVGAAGLTLLSQQAAGTPTIAFGTLVTADRKFTAQRVLAGSSVPSPRFDVVHGNVTARDGNTLTVRGGTLVRRDGSVRFVRGDITVKIGAETKVTREGGGHNLLRPQAISVGQRIHALGEVSGSDDGPVMNAERGIVRMNVTHLLGRVVSANPGLIALNLAAIDGRPAEIYNFAGTGGSAASDADPANYEVATGPLDLNGFPDGEPVRVFGFVTPFGFAPPDFVGRTLVDFSALVAELGIGWKEAGTARPFLSMSAEGVVIDIGNPDLGQRHHLKVGDRILDITRFDQPLAVKPASGDRKLYAIGQGDSVEVFREFGAFADALAAKIAGGAKVRAMHARGRFDAGNRTLTAPYVAVALVPVS